MKAAIDRLLEIGLLEYHKDKPRKRNSLGSHPGALGPQESASRSQESAAEGNGTEHHHQEGSRKKRQGTERPRDDLTPEHSGEVESEAKPCSTMGADDDASGSLYASLEDELKAIYEAKAGGPITIDLLDAIRTNLEFAGVAMSDYVAEVKKHMRNTWRNPPGFLRDLSRRFRAKTSVSPGPVTAAKAAVKNYRCPLCSSRVHGEGAVLSSEGKPVPCACATPEWIERQRARGVFAKEPPQ